MKNFQGYQKLFDYKNNSAEIITENIVFPGIYDRIVILSTLNTCPEPQKGNIIELSCMEMIGGKLTGREFDAYLQPRFPINEVTKSKTNLNNKFYQEFFDKVYSSDKDVLIQFKNFVSRSKIITFNTNKEIDFINNELSFHKIGIFQRIKFYSLINIFKNIFPSADLNINSLSKVIQFLEIRLPLEKLHLHSSKYDCFSLAKIIAKLYDIINQEKNKETNNNIKPIIKTEQFNLNSININNKKISLSSHKSSNTKTGEKNSENEFEYSDSLIELIEEENRELEENINENIIKNNNDILFKEENGKKSELNKDINLLNKKRNFGFEDLMNNLKNKVSPYKTEDEFNINFNPNELKFEK